MSKNQFDFKPLVLLTLLFVSKVVFNQELSEQYHKYDNVYSNDVIIFKGEKYLNKNRASFGYPYVFRSEPFVGNVIARRYELDSVELKYNVYRQVLVMSFQDHFGANRSIILNTGEIKQFSLNGYSFINTPLKIDGEIPFVQEIAFDSIKAYVSYRKDYKLINNNSKKGFGYTDILRRIYIEKHGEILVVKTKSKLLKCIPKSYHSNINNFISANEINIRKSKIESIIELLDFINELYTTK